MFKYKILGTINVLLSIFFIFILATSAYSKEPIVSLSSFIHAYALNGVLLFSLVVNSGLAYKLLIKKENKLPFYLYLVLTLSTVLWFLLLFIGYFLASNVIFLIILLAIIIAIFYFLRKPSQKIAITLSLITLLVSIIAIISSFEEDYCWGKGMQVDATGSKMVIATKEDAAALKGFDVKEGTQIGASFKAHMLCHNTFNLTEALNERYSFIK